MACRNRWAFSVKAGPEKVDRERRIGRLLGGAVTSGGQFVSRTSADRKRCAVVSSERVSGPVRRRLANCLGFRKSFDGQPARWRGMAELFRAARRRCS